MQQTKKGSNNNKDKNLYEYKTYLWKNCLSRAKSSVLNIDQCISKKKSKISLTSTESGRRKIINVAAIRKDETYQQLQNGNIDKNFKYHVTNSCFKNYAMKKTSESLSVRFVGFMLLSTIYALYIYLNKVRKLMFGVET